MIQCIYDSNGRLRSAIYGVMGEFASRDFRLFFRYLRSHYQRVVDQYCHLFLFCLFSLLGARRLSQNLQRFRHCSCGRCIPDTFSEVKVCAEECSWNLKFADVILRSPPSFYKEEWMQLGYARMTQSTRLIEKVVVKRTGHSLRLTFFLPITDN